MNRAYSLLTIKRIDDEQRTITGIATTPEVDAVGDIIEPTGAQFTLPIPLLWQHDASQPIGTVTAARVTPRGIEITAQIVKIDEPGTLKDRIDSAWQSIKSGLVKGLSIGFGALKDSMELLQNGGYRYLKWRWYELSAVTVPANSSASISAVKASDARYRYGKHHVVNLDKQRSRTVKLSDVRKPNRTTTHVYRLPRHLRP